MCTLFYSYVSKNNVHFLNENLLLFPESIRFRIEKYIEVEDRNARILSKLILVQGLSYFFSNEKIDLQYLQTNGKPSFKNLPIHFTISQSQDLVVVAFSNNVLIWN